MREIVKASVFRHYTLQLLSGKMCLRKVNEYNLLRSLRERL